MKSVINTFIAISLFSALFVSCKKDDEGEELSIAFKTGTGYTSSNATLEGGSNVKIGVTAETEKEKDPIIKFSITESVNGGASSTIYSQNLSNTKFDYDHSFVLDTVAGNTHKYTFNITNKDGKNAPKSLTITVK